MSTVPEFELDYVSNSIQAHPEYLKPSSVLNLYIKHGLKVLPDPFNPEVTNQIINALKYQIPYSVIRIGDGESNILTYDGYPATPNL